MLIFKCIKKEKHLRKFKPLCFSFFSSEGTEALQFSKLDFYLLIFFQRLSVKRILSNGFGLQLILLISSILYFGVPPFLVAKKAPSLQAKSKISFGSDPAK